jgi:3-deoxy-D-manno-octulosonate 8-phosphate phosphatase (KDO 8-P phosphatase)
MDDVHAAEDIKLLVLDVDGVLTDGSIQIDDHGVERKCFCSADGLGIRLWQKLGYPAAILTGRHGTAVQHRARELDIRYIWQGRMDKRNALAEMLELVDVDPHEVAMVGDDLPDLPVLRICGYPIAVANAVPEVQEEAVYITEATGGHGAVREAVEHLLKAKNRWHEALAMFE